MSNPNILRDYSLLFASLSSGHEQMYLVCNFTAPPSVAPERFFFLFWRCGRAPRRCAQHLPWHCPGSKMFLSTAFINGLATIQRVTVHRHTDATRVELSETETRARVDLVWALLPSSGYFRTLTCTDHFTRWPLAVPIHCAVLEVTAEAYMAGWDSRFCRFSWRPSTWLTFHRVLSGLFQTLRCVNFHITANHLLVNSLVERFQRQLNAATIEIHWYNTCKHFIPFHA